MPPFLDGAQINDALRNQAIPAIQALAANEALRQQSLERFERDGPPSYTSSTESDELEPLPPPEPFYEMTLAPEIQRIVDPPLGDYERQVVAGAMEECLYPCWVYHRECQIEAARLQTYESRNMIFRQRKGGIRFGTIVRRNVKRRMQKLGVWNPAWGIPGRSNEPQDCVAKWKWWWQADDSSGDMRKLADRAIHLRRDLRRGEHEPVVPCSRLGPDTTPSQADSFLISRPWFLFRLERHEEFMRFSWRLPVEQTPDDAKIQKTLVSWWKDRGDWRDEFDVEDDVNSWKWRHESPSPEPEDMTHLEPTDDPDYNPLDTMELTPSEADTLAAIELPRSQQPTKFWAIWSGDDYPFFHGQQVDPFDGRSPLTSPIRDRSSVRSPLFRSGTPPPREDVEMRSAPFRPMTPSPREDIEVQPLELQGTPSETPSDTPSEAQRDACTNMSPPQNQRRRGRGRPRGSVGRAQKSHGQSSPARRSTRIAAVKRAGEPIRSQAAPNKRLKAGTASNAAAPKIPQPAAQDSRLAGSRPAPARPPATEDIETQPRRGRGRPRKVTAGWDISSTVAKKQAGGTIISAGDASQPTARSPVTEVEIQPRRGRGRPRKVTAGQDISSAVTKKQAGETTMSAADASQPIARPLVMEVENQPRRGRGRPRKLTAGRDVLSAMAKKHAGETTMSAGDASQPTLRSPVKEVETQPRRGRGRPRKVAVGQDIPSAVTEIQAGGTTMSAGDASQPTARLPVMEVESQPRRGRGRPRKVIGRNLSPAMTKKQAGGTTISAGDASHSQPAAHPPVMEVESQPRRGRGRPRKVVGRNMSPLP